MRSKVQALTMCIKGQTQHSSIAAASMDDVLEALSTKRLVSEAQGAGESPHAYNDMRKWSRMYTCIPFGQYERVYSTSGALHTRLKRLVRERTNQIQFIYWNRTLETSARHARYDFGVDGALSRKRMIGTGFTFPEGPPATCRCPAALSPASDTQRWGHVGRAEGS